MEKILLAVMLLMALTGGSAEALTIEIDATDLGGWALGTNYWTGTNTNNMSPSEIGTAIGYTGNLYGLYKAEVPSGEEWSFSGSYTTVFTNSATDPEDADITYDGNGAIIDTAQFLYVKDGQHSPAWYVFAISGWDGLKIDLDNFWSGGGAISNIAIVGGTPVPEPATMLLFGTGLAGLAGVARRKKNQK